MIDDLAPTGNHDVDIQAAENCVHVLLRKQKKREAKAAIHRITDHFSLPAPDGDYLQSIYDNDCGNTASASGGGNGGNSSSGNNGSGSSAAGANKGKNPYPGTK